MKKGQSYERCHGFVSNKNPAKAGCGMVLVLFGVKILCRNGRLERDIPNRGAALERFCKKWAVKFG
jgi:hypothetical protein